MGSLDLQRPEFLVQEEKAPNGENEGKSSLHQPPIRKSELVLGQFSMGSVKESTRSRTR